MLQKITHLLLPACCLGCRAPVGESGVLCPLCFKQLAFNNGAQCGVCAEPLQVPTGVCERCSLSRPMFARHKSPLIYTPLMAKIILGFKNGGHSFYAKALSQWLAPIIKPFAEADAILAPIPLHFWQYMRRGYNQAALLVKHIHKYFPEVSADYRSLTRARHTQHQRYLSFDERQHNVAEAFRIANGAKNPFKNRRVLLIDDVCTTGATLNEAAKALLEAGAKEVICFTIAKASLHHHEKRPTEERDEGDTLPAQQ